MQTTLIHDLKWALILVGLSLALAMIWHLPFLQQSFQGQLFSHLQDLEKQEAARRLESIRTFNLQQTYAKHQEGKTLFIDARPTAEYEELHVEGAVNITADRFESREVQERLKKIDLQRPIIVYCANVDCHASLQVAELLQGRGFTQVAVFLGGFRAWDEAGYPVDITHH